MYRMKSLEYQVGSSPGGMGDYLLSREVLENHYFNSRFSSSASMVTGYSMANPAPPLWYESNAESSSPLLYEENKLPYSLEEAIKVNRKREESMVDSLPEYEAEKNAPPLYNPSGTTSTDEAHPEIFLRHDRPSTCFVNTTEEINEMIEEAFEKTTGKKLNNVTIKVCSEAEMKKLHPGWHQGILGFSVNFGFGNQVFVKKDQLERLLITIGHEIGHVNTPTLENSRSEEAKAFAFEVAWTQAIKEHNIGNLREVLKPGIPAQNGLHDFAFNFVIKKIEEGKEPMEVHSDIIQGKEVL